MRFDFRILSIRVVACPSRLLLNKKYVNKLKKKLKTNNETNNEEPNRKSPVYLRAKLNPATPSFVSSPVPIENPNKLGLYCLRMS